MEKKYEPQCGNGSHSSHYTPKELVNFLKPFGLVLNVGCGISSLSMIGDGSLGLEVVNIDVDLLSLRVLRNKNANITGICADAQHLPFKFESFNSVLVIEVLEHLPNPELCIREVHRVLKQGGLAIFTTPVLNIPIPCLVSIYRKLCGLQRANIEHLHVFSTSKLRNMLNSYFLIVDVLHRSFANNLLEKIFGAVWARKIVSRLSQLSKTCDALRILASNVWIRVEKQSSAKRIYRREKVRKFFICFTGIDGSGKTTLAKSLVDVMKQKGIKAKYVYNRYTPIILRPLIQIGEWLFLRGKDVFENYEEYTQSKKSASKKHPFWASLYQRILLFDYFFQILFKIKLPLLLGKNIVCDRYIYDTIVTDLSVDFNYTEEDVKKSLNMMLSLFPTPDITFLVDLPEEIAYLRKDDVPAVDYLKERRDIYLNIGEKYEMVILDGTKKLEELQNEIKVVVFK